MNFVGTGKRLSQGDIGEAARLIGIETAVLLAFLEVEASGRGFDNSNRPKMLFEPHIFYRELGAGSQRNQAVAQGLAYADWKRDYPADSYPRLSNALKINSEAALRSASWALPQILGNNCIPSGFPSASQMVSAMMQGEREQLLAMVTLLKSWGMVRMLTGRDFTKADSWRDAAKKYNGSGYEKNNYHVKLAAAYVKHKNGAPMTVAATVTLQPGMKGEAVRNLQNDLAYLGYDFTLGIDGRYGDQTRDIVRAFQQRSGLQVDGVAGQKTLAALAQAVAAAKVDQSPAAPEWDRGGGLLARLIAAILALFKK